MGVLYLWKTNNNKRVQEISKLIRNNTSSIPKKVLSIPTDEMLMFHKTVYSLLQFAMPDYGKAQIDRRSYIPHAG
jgi:hypothetical protein